MTAASDQPTGSERTSPARADVSGELIVAGPAPLRPSHHLVQRDPDESDEPSVVEPTVIVADSVRAAERHLARVRATPTVRAERGQLADLINQTKRTP